MNHTFRLIALGLVGLGAAGCASPMTNGAAQVVPVEQVYPITVEPQVATLVVRVDEGLQSLARGEDQRVHVFVERWKLRGQGLLNAATPTGAPNQAAATVAIEDLKRMLKANGVEDSAVQFSSYRAPNDDPHAPITLSFVTYAAVASECGNDWTENIAYTPRNLPWPEYGCSTQHNFAAVVSDPRDLIEPKASDGMIDILRRGTVYDKYRKGEATATRDTQDDKGKVSTVQQ